MTNTYKVILIGDALVGKSSIVERLIFNEFQNKYSHSTQNELYPHVLQINGESIKLNVWDIVSLPFD